jgi:hypothetical protein
LIRENAIIVLWDSPIGLEELEIYVISTSNLWYWIKLSVCGEQSNEN